MAEFIDREAALQFVFDACAECMDACVEFDGIYADCNQCMLEGVKLKLRDLPAADVRPVEWIPVTERLPEVRTWVLCYCRANSFDVFRMTDEGNWQYGNRSIYMKGYVTHWMPLPPAPKEE